MATAAPLLEPARLPFPLPKMKGRAFEDSFIAEGSGQAPFRWTATDGVLPVVQTGLLHASLSVPSTCAATDTAGFTDGVVECLFRATAAANSPWTGPAVRISGYNRYALLIYPAGGTTPQVTIWRLNAAAGGIQLAGNTTKWPQQNEWVYARLSVTGFLLEAVAWSPSMGFVLLTVTDTAYTSGYCGLTQMDNVSITTDYAWLRAVRR